MEPHSAFTGLATVTINDIRPDVTGTIAIGGSLVIPIDDPGQNANVIFQGTAGTRASLRVTGSDECQTHYAEVSIRGPLPDEAERAFACNDFVEPFALPGNGTYQIFFDPYRATAGQFTLNLYSAQPDVVQSIAIGGGSVSVSLPTPGQNATLNIQQFASPSTKPVTVHVTQNPFTTNHCVTVQLRRTSPPTVLASRSEPLSCAPSFDLPSETLAANTAYTISIDPAKWNTGSNMSVSITSP